MRVADSSNEGTIVLRCKRGSMQDRTFKVEAGGATIGRHDGCDFAVDPEVDVKVSGQHGRIEFDGESWTYTDLGSTNGSIVNGRVVNAGDPVRLRDESLIELGEDREAGTVAFSVSMPGAPRSQGGIETRCDGCGNTFEAPKSKMGRSVPCPGCGGPVEVPITAKLVSNPLRGGPGGSGFGDAPPSGPGDSSSSGRPNPGGGPPQFPAPPSSPGASSPGSSPPPPPQFGAGTPPATPGTPGAASQGGGFEWEANPVGGFIGKMKKAVKNFREKREIQDELNLCEQQHAGLQNQLRRELIEVGKEAWLTFQESAATLEGAEELAAGHTAIEETKRELTEAEEALEQARTAVSESAARWNARIEELDSVRSSRSAHHDESREAAATAERGYRGIIKDCLGGSTEIADRVRTALEAELGGFNAEGELSELATLMRRTSENITARLDQLGEPRAVFEQARDAAEAAGRDLEEAIRACEAADADRRTEQTELSGIVREAESAASGLTTAITEAESALTSHYHRLGVAVIESTDTEILGVDSRVYISCSSLYAQSNELEQRMSALNSKLQTL